MLTLEQVRERFRGDRFAAALGIEIIRADDVCTVCAMEVEDRHKNAVDTVQGGAIYTLADFAFAVAANREEMGTVTLGSTVHYLCAARSGRLTATARCVHAGRSTCLYEVVVEAADGAQVARVSATGYRRA